MFRKIKKTEAATLVRDTVFYICWGGQGTIRMAVYRGKPQDIPEGAIRLTEEQVREYHYRLIHGWEPKREVWPFRYGLGILGGFSALSAIYINNHYRTRLRLFNYGRLSSYLPIVVLPAVLSTLFHQTMVTSDILVSKTKCPVCVELRASALQVFFSTIYPVVLAPIGGLTMATRYFTYKIPDITKDPKGAFRVLVKFTKPIGTILGGIAIFQAVIASFITHCEADAFHRIQTVLLESEKEKELKD